MTVRGLTTPRRLSEDAIAALECGDIDALLLAERAEWGGSLTMMADGDDDDDDDDDDTGGSDDGDDDDKAGKKSKKSKKRSEDDDDDDDDDDDEDDDLHSEVAKLRKRMKAADKRADEAERKLRDKEREGTSEVDKLKEDLEEVTQKRDELAETVSTLRLENAFLTANEVDWHDADTALALARSKGYLDDVVDDDGEVDKRGLDKALKRLAKEHKYLVAEPKKSKRGASDDDGDDDGDDDEPGSSSGEPAGGRSTNNKDTKAKKSKMRERFPVLR